MEFLAVAFLFWMGYQIGHSLGKRKYAVTAHVAVHLCPRCGQPPEVERHYGDDPPIILKTGFFFLGPTEASLVCAPLLILIGGALGYASARKKYERHVPMYTVRCNCWKAKNTHQLDN